MGCGSLGPPPWERVAQLPPGSRFHLAFLEHFWCHYKRASALLQAQEEGATKGNLRFLSAVGWRPSAQFLSYCDLIMKL